MKTFKQPPQQTGSSTHCKGGQPDNHSENHEKPPKTVHHPCHHPGAAIATAGNAISSFSASYLTYPRNSNGRVRVFGSVSGQSFSDPFASNVEIDASSDEQLETRDLRVLP